MTELILKDDGSPFADRRIAAMRSGTLKKKGMTTEVVEYPGGGFALKEVQEQPRKRVPLGTRNILSVEPEDGYVQRFVSDTEDRIERFEAAGWEVAPKKPVGDEMVGKDNSIGSRTTKNVGGGVVAVLMRKREDWFNEDYAEKQKKIDLQEQGLIRQTQKDGQYGNININ